MIWALTTGTFLVANKGAGSQGTIETAGIGALLLRCGA